MENRKKSNPASKSKPSTTVSKSKSTTSHKGMGSPQGKFEKPTGGFYNSKSNPTISVSKSKPTAQVAKKSPQAEWEKANKGPAFSNSKSESTVSDSHSGKPLRGQRGTAGASNTQVTNWKKSTTQVAKKPPNKKF